MTTQQMIIRAKVGVLELVEQLVALGASRPSLCPRVARASRRRPELGSPSAYRSA